RCWPPPSAGSGRRSPAARRRRCTSPRRRSGRWPSGCGCAPTGRSCPTRRPWAITRAARAGRGWRFPRTTARVAAPRLTGTPPMKPELIALARASLLLASAPEPVARAVLAEAHVRHFDRGATIFLQGERARAIYIVVEGWVKLYRIAPNGAEAVVGAFTKGASFGEAVAFRHDTYPVAAE